MNFNDVLQNDENLDDVYSDDVEMVEPSDTKTSNKSSALTFDIPSDDISEEVPDFSKEPTPPVEDTGLDFVNSTDTDNGASAVMPINDKTLLDFDDYSKVRKNIFDRTLESVYSSFPVTNNKYTVRVSDLQYDTDSPVRLAEQKQMIAEGKSITRKLQGKFEIVDNATGQVIGKTGKKTIMNVPYFTERGTFVRNGTEYTVAKQFRLAPSIYTRKTADGLYEAQFNVRPRTGRSFRMYMEPDTSLFYLRVEGRKVPLYPVLQKLGVSDEVLSKKWGKAIFDINSQQAVSPHSISWMRQTVGEGTPEEQSERLRTYFSQMEFDPDAVRRTVGAPHKNATPEAIVDASSKVLRLSRGLDEADDRDSLVYQSVHDFSDFLSEKIKNDQTGIMRKVLWKITGRNGDPSVIPTGAFDKYVDHLFNVSGVAQPVEEISPIDNYSQNQRVVRLGEGAMSSVDVAPMESRGVSPSYLGFVDPIRAPQSLRVGLDNYFARGVRKGPNNLLYKQFQNAKTGEMEWVSNKLVADSVIGFPEFINSKDKFVPAMVNSKGIQYVPKKDVGYYITNGDDIFSRGSDTVPIKSGVKGMRLLMGSAFVQQALPLVNRESPHVQTLDSDGKRSVMEYLGKYMGARHADRAGTVTSVGNDGIHVVYDNGEKDVIDLYNNFALARKSGISNIPVVKRGDSFKKGGLLAYSNFTDSNGIAAPGTNLNVAYMPYEGLNYEDAVVISESASKKMAAENMYQEKFELTDGMRTGLKSFHALFPSKYSKDQISNLDQDGVIKPGTVVKYGDPLFLAVMDRVPSLSNMGRRITTDSSSVWEHSSPGVVTDVFKTKTGYNIFVKSENNVLEGDKTALAHGGKGVVSRVVPDAEMPRTASGTPIDIILSPLGVISRTNPAQLVTAALGKVSAKTGKKYIIPGFSDANMAEFAKQELAKNGLSDTEDVIDPKTGKIIPKIFVGNTYVYRMQQTAESKGKSRSLGFYDQDEVPGRGGAEGSKHLGNMEYDALLAHGATQVLRDMKLIKGQKNDDFWRQIKLGRTPSTPNTPFVYQKFKDLIEASGVHISSNNGNDNLFAMTNDEVKKLTGSRKLASSATFAAGTLKPIAGGLFDPEATGSEGEGDRFSYYELPEPMLNPVMESPVRAILGVTQKGLDDIISGRQEYNGLRGGNALKKMLEDVDVKGEMRKAMTEIKSGSKSKKDAAVKKYRFLYSMSQKNTSPSDFMMDRVAVLPPRYRPITKQGDTIIANDMNYMYKQLAEGIEDFKDTEGLPSNLRENARSGLYTSYKALVGLVDPVKPELVQKNIGGIFQQLFSKGSPKQSFVQRKVIGANVDLTGLGVAQPDPTLKLNQIGLPEEKAWELYEPFIIRDMVLNGIPATVAAREVANKGRVAYRSLQTVVKDRPVLVNRAPTLHKYGIMAFWPVLTKGDSVRTNPSVTKPYGLDYDGDSILGSIGIQLELEKLKTSATLVDNENDLFSLTTTKGEIMFSKNTNLATINANIRLEDMPIIHGTKVESENGNIEYDVPSGIFIRAIERSTMEQKTLPITKFSIHPNCQMYDVTTGGNYSKVITTSEDHSLLVFDPETNAIELCKPTDSVGKLMPSAKELFDPEFEHSRVGVIERELDSHPDLKYPLTWNSGFLYGSMIGNGWVDATGRSFLSSYQPELRALITEIVETDFGSSGTTEIRTERVSIGGGVGVAERLNLNLPRRVSATLASAIGQGSHNKVIPHQSLSGPYTHLVGMMCGLMNSDATISAVEGQRKGKPGLKCVIKYDTVSPYLRDSFVYLCSLLGIKTTVSTYIATVTKTPAYAILLCIPDFVNFYNKVKARFPLYKANCAEAMDTIVKKAASDTECMATDLVPYNAKYHSYVSFANGKTKALHTDCSSLSVFKNNGYWTRDMAYRFVKDFQCMLDTNKIAEEDKIGFIKWISVIKDESLTWKPIASVTDAGIQTCYDITVPDAFTFATSSGIYVQDTMSYSVPVSSSAVKDALRLMLPEKNLLSDRNDNPHFLPGQEYAQGLLYASRQPGKLKKTRVFRTKDEMRKALVAGEIKIDDPIEILG